VHQITAHILQAAREYVDRETVACTEWPTTEEVATLVLDQAALWPVHSSQSNHRIPVAADGPPVRLSVGSRTYIVVLREFKESTAL